MTCVREGAETPLFKQNFTDWLNKDETTSLIKPKKVSVGGGGERKEEKRERGREKREGRKGRERGGGGGMRREEKEGEGSGGE